MAGLLGARAFRRRKKEVIFIDGYVIDNANDFVPGVDRQDETFHVYGDDSPLTDVQHNYGSVQLGVLDKGESPNAVLDLLTGQKPTSTGPRQYSIAALTSVDLWANIKNSTNTQYTKCMLYAGWTPGMPLPTGAPNDKAAYSVQGNSELPRQFHGCWIDTERLASGTVCQLSVPPMQVPGETGIYALRVRALSVSGATIVDQEVIPVSTTMVTVTGAVSCAVITSLLQDITTYTHVYVLFLRSGTGVYPTNAPDGIYG